MKVPNKEIREAFLRSGLSTHEVAKFCNWFKKSGYPDSSKVSRTLGLLGQKKNGKIYTNTYMKDTIALEIIEVLNLDPVDFRDIGL